MANIFPYNYCWLLKEGAPKMLQEFLKIYGVEEIIGTGDNPIILSWAKETGLSSVYIHDSIAWCGLTMALIAQRAGKPVVKDPLWALNWQNFGQPVAEPMLGDVLVFTRSGGGHVALYLGETDDYFHIGGGNQADATGIMLYGKSNLVAARRPIWQIAQPANVRKISLNMDGTLAD